MIEELVFFRLRPPNADVFKDVLRPFFPNCLALMLLLASLALFLLLASLFFCSLALL